MKETTTYGITGYGAYVPRLRMRRDAIAAAHRWMSPGLAAGAKGNRAFCSWDEDSITMAVEAARSALANQSRASIQSLTIATTRPAFADLQGASIVAGALALPADLRTADIGQSQRAGVSGLLTQLRAADSQALFIASDHPSAKPASAQELGYGAGAAAFTLGSEGVIAELIGAHSVWNMFVDHFRSNDSKHDYYWEERWIRDEGYAKIVPDAVGAALKSANLEAANVSHFIFASPLKGSSAMVAKRCGIAAEALGNAVDEQCGYAGAAHPCLMLADALERCKAGEVIVLVGFGQGCDVLVLRATEAIEHHRPLRGVPAALADAQEHADYLRMLSYDKGIELEWGMRSEKPVKTALSEQYRSADQLGAMVGCKCSRCGTVQFPRMAYCVGQGCGAPATESEPVPLSDVPAKVLTCTADWLSYHPSPPLRVGFVQFENGARVLMEIVDVGEAGLDVGMPLRMTYRIKDVDAARGYARYFWKATPVAA
ncbi:3-oxoacyl-[acyl-carrier-protein] synthase III C-terminal domain-containing protein [Variovorax sp. YR216]|uniref:3-oxoacyl-[acyl-carrier-protein] synthase III C-terminal domain-containing protein n=1 Tax=Variovorax sp. YR216 TaxID=1882828 RepID=UPI00089C226E|nr:3-oxoacyl-[acyl-carrier-protein] synthase III C-terminal domain-containing protein [Variovorax sp. YR216]SEB24721.1 3-hydroxy-3-methylglutaryl CoA synthase [Variovorax sp. YR216]